MQRQLQQTDALRTASLVVEMSVEMRNARWDMVHEKTQKTMKSTKKLV
jgi:hypothetical protein